MGNLKKLKEQFELLSMRISIAISVLWIAYILMESSNLMNMQQMYGEIILGSLLIGLALIWLLKLVLSSVINNKER